MLLAKFWIDIFEKWISPMEIISENFIQQLSPFLVILLFDWHWPKICGLNPKNSIN